MEFARDKIRVNGVHPGIVNTPLAFDKKTGKELVAVDSFAIPRQATPEEIAEYVSSSRRSKRPSRQVVNSLPTAVLLGPLEESR